MNTKNILIAFLLLSISLIVTSFQSLKTLKGTWEYVGDIYNGKKEGAPDGYSLRKKYTDTSYQAFMIEKGSKPEKYEAGRYILKNDTCVDIETFCAQPSSITNIPINYVYNLNADTITFKGVLPSGRIVEEYWKKVK